MLKLWISLGLSLIIFSGILAQDEAPLTVINAGNVISLQSVAHIDFAQPFNTLRFQNPTEADAQATTNAPEAVLGGFNTGWFVTNPDGSNFAILTTSGELWAVSADQKLWYKVSPPTNADGLAAALVDAAFGNTSIGLPLFALYSDNESYQIQIEDGQIYGNSLYSFRVESSNRAESIWINCPVDIYYECAPRVEVTAPSGEESIVQLPPQTALYDGTFTQSLIVYKDQIELPTLDYPADENAMVRIGRIISPYHVTSSAEGVIKLWSLETGKLLTEVQVENGPAVFGQINNSASHLAWRDPYSENLNLLNFETGENKVIAPLNNEYVQWFFVGEAADVVLGVHIGDNPVVVAWIVETGERIELGEYRECSRVPDMVRLSRDGKRLVIGCDTGLDIWQIQGR